MRLRNGPPQAGEMNLLLDRICHPLRRHRLFSRLAVDRGLAGRAAPEQSLGVAEHDGPAARRADHGAAHGAIGIIEIGADRLREFAGLAAVFILAPARRARQPRDAHAA